MTDPTVSLATPYRSHTCGQLRSSDAGDDARLAGWVHRRRDHGPLIFLDLRDRHGITQVVIDKADAPAAHEIASRVRNEFVVSAAGEVAPPVDPARQTRIGARIRRPELAARVGPIGRGETRGDVGHGRRIVREPSS